MAKPKKIWDNYLEIAEVQKSNRIKFVVSAATREGIRYLNIREFYLRQKDNVWRPGRDGITIPLTVPIAFNEETNETTLLSTYEEMLKALVSTATIAKDMALSDPDHAVYVEPKETK